MKRFYATTSVTQGGKPVLPFRCCPFLKPKEKNCSDRFILIALQFLDCELGYLRSISFTVEDAAIWVIEKKQEYENLVNRYEQKSKMLENALQSLPPKERETFYTEYMNSPTSPLIQKICASLHDQQVAYFKEKRIKQFNEYIVA